MIRAAKEIDFDSVKNITQTTIWSVYPKYYPSGAVQFFSDHHSDERIKADIDARKVFLLEIDETEIGTVTVADNEINRSKEHESIILDASLPAKQMYLKRGYVSTKYKMIETENGDYLCYDVMEKHL